MLIYPGPRMRNLAVAFAADLEPHLGNCSLQNVSWRGQVKSLIPATATMRCTDCQSIEIGPVVRPLTGSPRLSQAASLGRINPRNSLHHGVCRGEERGAYRTFHAQFRRIVTRLSRFYRPDMTQLGLGPPGSSQSMLASARKALEFAIGGRGENCPPNHLTQLVHYDWLQYIKIVRLDLARFDGWQAIE